MARVEFILRLLTLACLITVAYSGSCCERLMSGCGENITISLSVGQLTTAPPSVQYLTAPPLDQSTTDRTSCPSITPLPTPLPTDQIIRGFDVASAVSEDEFRCLYDERYRFVITRAYRNVFPGVIDCSAVNNIKYARAAGFTRVDVYMWPVSQRTKLIEHQVAEMVTALKGSYYDQIWIDIEEPDVWQDDGSMDKTQNQGFLCDLLNEFKNRLPEKTVGIYTNCYGWSEIMGNDDFMCGNRYRISSRQLWFAHYDDRTSLTRVLEPWSRTTTNIKQFNKDQTVCGVKLDENVRLRG